MSTTGIEIPDDLIKEYEEMRFEKKPQGMILKISEGKVILEQRTDASFDDLIESLPDNEPRYVLYDFPIKNRVGLDDTRMLFLFWMPMESSVRDRMSYAGTKKAITTAFKGISTQIQEDDKNLLTFERVKNKIAARQGMNYQQL
ncbi:MAG: hypothetical protein D6732_03700 [Methanobacteriota archaeon]|nr:MAG: hypothetical protein D6732_03700 [Euryarchaeota archaeon]